jgi:protein-S-isoprenylcysteine O-methyltransferase Ste14
VGGFVVPRTIDSGPSTETTAAVLIDLALLSLFAFQHSVMARPFFKRWWTTVIPPAAERSTYVLLSSLCLFLLYWQWRPLPGVIWNITQPILAGVLWALFVVVGWVIVLISTFLINHFDLFGLRQIYLQFVGRPYTPIPFRTPLLYRFVRHPIMVGFLIAFWATPTMTQGHLLFATVVTAYVLIALKLEERDLLTYYGEEYSSYRRQVRMLLPLPRASQPVSDLATHAEAARSGVARP